ncbi:MAG TPA: transketolase [Limnochordia bacterium]|nr:transketolase [Limnochordia bacterium]
MPLTAENVQELRRTADRVRALVIETVHGAKAGHIGGPLSMAEIVTTLYFHVLKIDPARPRWEERDRFVLSKGHAAVGLYATLALRGYFPPAELKTFDKLDSRLQAHPDMTALPGLDMSTGSLGQGLSAAVGMALGAKLKGSAFRTYALVGDGESQEGQIWEAAAVASRYRLDNLIVFLDCNGLQQFGWSEGERRLPPQDESLAGKWRAFGWAVHSIDGHDPAQIVQAAEAARETSGRPTAVIARTRKGRGVSFMEGNYEWHARIPTDQELQAALAELGVNGR